MEPGNVQLEPKPFLTEAQMAEVWEGRGLKFGCDDLYNFCRSRGMHPHIEKDAFRRKFRELTDRFLVRGEAQGDPRETLPTEFKD